MCSFLLECRLCQTLLVKCLVPVLEELLEDDGLLALRQDLHLRTHKQKHKAQK